MFEPPENDTGSWVLSYLTQRRKCFAFRTPLSTPVTVNNQQKAPAARQGLEFQYLSVQVPRANTCW
jgi:hypothetical protein